MASIASKTPVTWHSAHKELSFDSALISIGSCFATHVAQQLSDWKFDMLANPFGISYNPLSIVHNLKRIYHKEALATNRIIHHEGLYHSWDHHSDFSSSSQSTLIQDVATSDQLVRDQLKKAKQLIITLGTSKVFRHKTSNHVVNNCHRVPNTEFDTSRLSLQETIDVLREMVHIVHQINEQTEILLTVSPIRHARDGFIENQRNKATLILAIEEILKSSKPICHYFPVYEIFMDELRDYRYYTQDMIHPSKQAIKYIIDVFIERYFDAQTPSIIHEIQKIQKALAHRPLHIHSDTFVAFVHQVEQQLSSVEKKYPLVSWESEKRKLSALQALVSA